MSGLDIRNNRIMIDVACNDPDNGIFAHRAEMISVASDFLDLELCARAPRFIELPGKFRLAGKTWPITGSKEWVGNWCWNGYWMDIPKAVEFLAWLQAKNIFRCTCGEERVYNTWNAPVAMTADDRAFFSRLLGKPSTWGWAA